MKKKFYGLDHLRAFAILQVFFFHYYIISGGKPAWLPTLAKFGWTGVDLFFVLSGFLIASPLFAQIKNKRNISYKTFFIKRFFRIVPAYVFTVALYFLFPFFREKEHLAPLWKYLTFTQNLGLNIEDNGTFSHAWSLCVEEHFYLLLPLALLLLGVTGLLKKSYLLLPLLFIAGLLLRSFSYNKLYLPFSNADNNWMHWYKYIYYPTYNRLDGLLAGVSIACTYQFLPAVWARLARLGNLHFPIGLALLTAAYFLCNRQMEYPASVYGFPLIALGYGFWVMGALSPNSFLYKWKSRFTTFIATLSYAIYLTHKGIIHSVHYLFKNHMAGDEAMLVISMAAGVAFALLIHLIIEQPFMRWREKLLPKA